MKYNMISFAYDENTCMLKNVNKKGEPKSKNSPTKPKKKKDHDILMTLSDYQGCNQSYDRNVTDYKNLLKSTCKDIRRVRDAVLVRSLPIYKKQFNELKFGKQYKDGKDNKENSCLLITQMNKNNKKSLNGMCLNPIQMDKMDRSLDKVNVNKSKFKFEHHHKNSQHRSTAPEQNQFRKTFNKRLNSTDKIVECEGLGKDRKNQWDLLGCNRIVVMNKTETIMNQKIAGYLYEIKANAYLYGISNFQSVKNYNRKKYNFRARVKKGNNSELVKWVLKKRWWWSVEDQRQGQKNSPNFIWSQLKDKSFFTDEKPIDTDEPNPLFFSHNHFPSNQYLGNKKALFYNMSTYYKNLNKNVFDILPLTFHVMSMQDQSWKQFQKIYNENCKEKIDNTWIIKPGENSNRGRGITVSNSFEEIRMLMSFGGADVDKKEQRSFILQKYIDQPFLYNQRKFDIRAYVLIVKINNRVRGFWYEDGYVRTSSFEYQLDDFNTFVHLTNDAIQTHSQQYGKYEQGNKLSYTHFQKYLDTKYPQCHYDIQKQLVPQMKSIALDSIKSSYKSILTGSTQSPIFQIFGLDFMIDQNFKPWLIEVNTNPCLQTSSNILRKIIPKMLDDAFKLTLDVIFPPPENWQYSKKYVIPSLKNKFQLIFSADVQGDIDGFMVVEVPGELSEDEQVYEEK